MEAWQVVILAFFALLPVVLALDFWGDERVDSRGKPIRRPWIDAGRRAPTDDKASHDERVGAHSH